MANTIRYGHDLVDWLTEARRGQGLSQAELAKRLGVAPSHLSRIEHGADPRLSTFLEIARELRIEPILVPKEYVAAVRALLDSLRTGSDMERPRFA